jgi:hypothetical protein
MDHADDNDWCSINEAARRLNVTPTAIRSRIKRGTLKIKPNGTHGRLVQVPLPVPGTGALPVTLTPDEPVTSTLPGKVPEPVPLTAMETVSVLSRYIERLEAQLDEALKRADDGDEIAVERDALAVRLDALKTVLEIEKQRTDDWKVVADRFALLAEKPTTARAGRPWWLPRLAG